MRDAVDLPRLRNVIRALGSKLRGEGRVYLVGGATALWHGWRETTIDIDLKADPEPGLWFESLAAIKEELRVNLELAAPDDFIPELPGWRDRSPFIERMGKIDFFHYDLASQALAKIQRGHDRDIHDARAMVAAGLVDPAKLVPWFEAIEPAMIRFPGIDPREFRRSLDAFLASLPGE